MKATPLQNLLPAVQKTMAIRQVKASKNVKSEAFPSTAEQQTAQFQSAETECSRRHPVTPSHGCTSNRSGQALERSISLASLFALLSISG